MEDELRRGGVPTGAPPRRAFGESPGFLFRDESRTPIELTTKDDEGTTMTATTRCVRRGYEICLRGEAKLPRATIPGVQATSSSGGPEGPDRPEPGVAFPIAAAGAGPTVRGEVAP